MAPIGLIAAMNEESSALLRLVKPWVRIKVGQLNGYSFTLSKVECILVTCGMGIRRAGEAARALVEQKAPRVIISFGIAGAVEPELEIGDVILAEAFCHLGRDGLSSLQPLQIWSASALEAARQAIAPQGKHVQVGTAITTRGAQVSSSQVSGLLHPVLEMETAGIARVAAEKCIPLMALRAISDGPRSPIPVDPGDVMDEEGNLKPGKLLKVVMQNPGILLQYRRIMHNTRLGADCAAMALAAALTQKEF